MFDEETLVFDEETPVFDEETLVFDEETLRNNSVWCSVLPVYQSPFTWENGALWLSVKFSLNINDLRRSSDNYLFVCIHRYIHICLFLAFRNNFEE